MPHKRLLVLVTISQARISGLGNPAYNGATPKTSRNGDRLVMEVPRIRLHEVVAVDLV
jgi:hypothetical protein